MGPCVIMYYRCTQCDFDLCVTCFKKKNRGTGEGLIRGDKGAKDEVEISSTGYMLRAVRLATTHWVVILGAVVCLIATSASQLLLPK